MYLSIFIHESVGIWVYRIRTRSFQRRPHALYHLFCVRVRPQKPRAVQPGSPRRSYHLTVGLCQDVVPGNHQYVLWQNASKIRVVRHGFSDNQGEDLTIQSSPIEAPSPEDMKVGIISPFQTWTTHVKTSCWSWIINPVVY